MKRIRALPRHHQRIGVFEAERAEQRDVLRRQPCLQIGQQLGARLDVAGVFAGMFVLSAFVIVIDMGVTLVERRLLVWRPAPADGRG
jgi:hypothetical protein